MNPFNLPHRQPEIVPDFIRAMDLNGTGKLAIYDADGTLWRDDVADDSTRWMIDSGTTLDNGATWEEYFRIYRQDHAAGCRYLLRFFEGLPLEHYHERLSTWWRELANRHWIPEVLESLYLLADRGYTIWVVTGSPTDSMRPLMEFLPVDAIVGMDFEVNEDGIITGNHAGISCADEGKAEKVRFLWGDRPIPFAAGNGALDQWMMELADQVIWSVFPNQAFEAISRERGWHILPRPADFVEEVKLA